MAKANPGDQPRVRRLHGLDLSTNHQFRTTRQFLAAVVDDLLNFIGDSAEIAPLNRSVDIDHRLNVVVRHQGHSRAPLDGSQRPRIAGLAPEVAGDRNVLQLLQGVDTVLRSLRRDGVAHAILGIEPVSRRGLETAAQRNQQVGRNVALREADQLRLGPVNIDVQMRFIERLLDAQISGSGNHFDSSQQFVGELAILAPGYIRRPEYQSEPEDRSSESG